MHLYLATDLRPADGDATRRPTRTSTCSSSGCRGARPSPPPNAARSATRKTIVALLWLARLLGAERLTGRPARAYAFGGPSRSSASR